MDEPCNDNEILLENTLDCININSPTCRDSSNTVTFDGYSFVRMNITMNLTQHINTTFTFRTQSEIEHAKAKSKNVLHEIQIPDQQQKMFGFLKRLMNHHHIINYSIVNHTGSLSTPSSFNRILTSTWFRNEFDKSLEEEHTVKTDSLKKFEETVCTIIDSSTHGGMTKPMPLASLFDELRLLIESTAPKNIQEKLFNVFQAIDLRSAEKTITELSGQVTDLRSAVQGLQERQHERDAILHAFKVSFLYRYHIVLPIIRRHYPKIRWSEIVNVVKQTSPNSLESACRPPSPKIMAKRRELQSLCSIDLDKLVHLSSVRNEVMHIQIANIDEQKMLLEQMEHYLDSKSIREFKDSIKNMLNELKNHKLEKIQHFFN
ncbi:unnamed protein product [Rotaria sordida]|uniref:Uncharacterized protein n=1 Tax=Rotaria sordida TaxID=392033 RepID=A0A819XT70_9BILA|nr:unnamed protein product [Rotaria sordida]